MPQLYAIQLAGQSNAWNCDCHLRALVRSLRSGRALSGSGSASGWKSRILQDEPQCHSFGVEARPSLALRELEGELRSDARGEQFSLLASGQQQMGDKAEVEKPKQPSRTGATLPSWSSMSK